jgi:CheY-like chemotaxis protein
VIEDGEVERKFIGRSLEKNGLRVSLSDNGPDGLALARKERFDLIILDFYLPKMNGKVICQSLKADAATRDIPVIFLTGSASPKDLIECYEVGA